MTVKLPRSGLLGIQKKGYEDALWRTAAGITWDTVEVGASFKERIPVFAGRVAIDAFPKKVAAGNIELCNEYSLQHELGVFLASTAPALQQPRVNANIVRER